MENHSMFRKVFMRAALDYRRSIVHRLRSTTAAAIFIRVFNPPANPKPNPYSHSSKSKSKGRKNVKSAVFDDPSTATEPTTLNIPGKKQPVILQSLYLASFKQRSSVPFFKEILSLFPEDKDRNNTFPRLLFEGHKVYDTNLIFMVDALALVIRTILFGQMSLILDHKPSKNSNGFKWGVKGVTPSMIAFAAIVSIYIHSDDTNLGSEYGNVTNYPYHKMYMSYRKFILKGFRVAPNRFKDLIAFYNSQVFVYGDPHMGLGTSHSDDDENDEHDVLNNIQPDSDSEELQEGDDDEDGGFGEGVSFLEPADNITIDFVLKEMERPQDVNQAEQDGDEERAENEDILDAEQIAPIKLRIPPVHSIQSSLLLSSNNPEGNPEPSNRKAVHWSPSTTSTVGADTVSNAPSTQQLPVSKKSQKSTKAKKQSDGFEAGMAGDRAAATSTSSNSAAGGAGKRRTTRAKASK
ncbi:hypothetical protein CVT24_011982 [Panaeolus cyanescens]|uniref:Uncharacterized protein n=1 Tax=Panaeolus cyanescens TaxID=181874 RepID=A0A409X5Z0_9AGAR|nr:hypothetical protein CVT24_011982 [Panaeolus cyanescens]